MKITIEELFETMEQDGYEQIVLHHDKKTGLKAISAIHNTELGFALGGTRHWDYHTESEAMFDVLRLSKGMTYKAAGAGLMAGGSKHVIIGRREDKTPELIQTYGRFIDTFKGRVQTGQDVGITPADVTEMLKGTRYIAGKPSEGKSTAYYTAIGVFAGMKAAMIEAFGSDSFKDKTVAIQGVGAVGHDLAKYIHDAGGKILFADVNEDNVDRILKDIPEATRVNVRDIMSVEADIFSPNALGNILTDETIPDLHAKVIAGAANNVLGTIEDADLIERKGIVYAPDYIINAAGVIRAYWDTVETFSEEGLMDDVMAIGPRITEIIKLAKELGISTAKAADKYAEKFIEEHGDGQIWNGSVLI